MCYAVMLFICILKHKKQSNSSSNNIKYLSDCKKIFKNIKKRGSKKKIFKKDGLKAPSKIDYSTGVLSDPKKFKEYTKTDAFKENETLKLPYLKSIAELMEKNMLENPSSIGMWAAFMRESDFCSFTFTSSILLLTLFQRAIKGSIKII